MWHEILHAVIHSLELLPFLFICYILIELIESWTSTSKINIFSKGGTEVLFGSVAGLIPQCGFGVVATDMYTKKKISMGTLLAVYIATSDEAFPILLSHPEKAGSLLPLLAIKFLVALLVGYIVFGIEQRLIKKSKTRALEHSHDHNHTHHDDDHNHEHDDNGHDHEHEHSHDNEALSTVHIGCCGHHIEETGDEKNRTKQNLKRYLLHPLKHTAIIFAYILVINIMFGLLVHFIGEDSLKSFLSQAKIFTPLLACIVGLIPNCASSVVLTNMYCLGSLPFGALLSGLIVNAGISITVLFKQNKSIKNTLLILGILIGVSLLSGYATLWLI